MKTPRFKKLSWWFAGVYLAFSALVYFGSLGSESHSWWPIFLYPLIWPLGWIEHSLVQPMLDGWLAPDPKSAADSVWVTIDRISGGYYIVIGTLWFWVLGKLLARVADLFIPRKESWLNQPLQGTPAKAPSSSTEPDGRRS